MVTMSQKEFQRVKVIEKMPPSGLDMGGIRRVETSLSVGERFVAELESRNILAVDANCDHGAEARTG
jgi:hypothetical protein